MLLLYTEDSQAPTNVRSGSSVNHQKNGQLENHTLITVVQKTNNNWLEISDPISGFIYGELARPETPQFDRGKIGSIAAWQHLLNGCGYHPDNASKLVITGEFDEKTIAVTKKFQQNLGLPENGNVIDLNTWQKAFDHKKLPGWLPVVTPPPIKLVEPPANNLSEAEKYDYCRQVILSNGGIFRDDVNRRNLLSFRRESCTEDNQWQGNYNDVTLMLWKDSAGHKHYCQYQSNTEPCSRYEDRPGHDPRVPILGQDADGDRRKDLGRLQEGYYEYQKSSSTHFQNPNVLRPTAFAKTVIRDINHNGRFEPGEPTLGADDMLFHEGFVNGTGSAGCQTMPPDVYRRFWKDLNANGDPGVVGYTIVRWKSL